VELAALPSSWNEEKARERCHRREPPSSSLPLFECSTALIQETLIYTSLFEDLV